MARYHVASGDLRTIIDAPSMMEALIDAFRERTGTYSRLTGMTLVSEAGFDEDHDEARFYPTAHILCIWPESRINSNPNLMTTLRQAWNASRRKSTS